MNNGTTEIDQSNDQEVTAACKVVNSSDSSNKGIIKSDLENQEVNVNFLRNNSNEVRGLKRVASAPQDLNAKLAEDNSFSINSNNLKINESSNALLNSLEGSRAGLANKTIESGKRGTVHSKTMENLSSYNQEGTEVGKPNSLSSITKWWKGYVELRKQKRKQVEQTEELKMRHKLQYHFMTPFQKYKLGRKPWKLAVQVLKILIVTTQVLLFGADRFAAVNFIKHTQISFENLFIWSYDGSSSFSYFAREDLVSAIKHADYMYKNLDAVSVGQYWHSEVVMRSIPPIKICITRFLNRTNHMEIDPDAEKHTKCQDLTNDIDFASILNEKRYFDRVVDIQLMFELNAIYLNGLKLRHLPECFSFKNVLFIDNSFHDGKLRVNLNVLHELMSQCPKRYQLQSGFEASEIRNIFIGFDCFVIITCLISCLLCMRSLVKSIMLAEAAQSYFNTYKNETLDKWDLFQLINKWFGVIIISDLLSIVGSIYKIKVDERNIRFYNICSVLLGLGVLLVWIGILRFFTYLKKYNILLITLRSAAPNLLRFMFCAMFIFIGFTFCGWIVLAPYHKKFQTFLSTSECLFSLLNGDDMYPTFASMSHLSLSIWVFSKVYVYCFVSLFIYVVLSTFISIVGDTYERLKDWGRMPPTRIEMFMIGRTNSKNEDFSTACPRCIRECDDNTRTLYGSFQRHSSVSSSQMSLVSASLE